MMAPQPRRKKWSEAEERTLIEKYGDMVCSGTLAKMKTREKKYVPIALHVNSVHHLRDPVAYPWQWTWKDVSTKVQNMRHQYALVKQKIKKEGDGVEEFDWAEGTTHWSNFLRYKEVFGDVMLAFNNGGESMAGVGDAIENSGGFDGSAHGIELVQFGHLSHSGDFGGDIDGVENDALGIGFDYGGEGGENYNSNNNNNGSNKSDNPLDDGDDDGGFVYEDIEPVGSDTRKKRKALKTWGFLSIQLAQLKEMETRFEQREVERERERQRRENARMEMEKRRERKLEEKEREREQKIEEMRSHMLQQWEAMEKESEERERRMREEASVLEKEREERMDRRRSESKKRMDEMVRHHRAEMNQIQSRMLHEQQNLTGHLLGILSRWTGPHPTTLPVDHTGATNHYLSQMMQSLHHVNAMIHGDAHVEGDHQGDHFIVDG